MKSSNLAFFFRKSKEPLVDSQRGSFVFSSDADKTALQRQLEAVFFLHNTYALQAVD